jgi:hypothetical protein
MQNFIFQEDCLTFIFPKYPNMELQKSNDIHMVTLYLHCTPYNLSWSNKLSDRTAPNHRIIMQLSPEYKQSSKCLQEVWHKGLIRKTAVNSVLMNERKEKWYCLKLRHIYRIWYVMPTVHWSFSCFNCGHCTCLMQTPYQHTHACILHFSDRTFRIKLEAPTKKMHQHCLFLYWYIIWLVNSDQQKCKLTVTSCWLLAWLTLQQWRWRQYVPTKHWLTFTGLHSIISLKWELFIVTAVRISNSTL